MACVTQGLGRLVAIPLTYLTTVISGGFPLLVAVGISAKMKLSSCPYPARKSKIDFYCNCSRVAVFTLDFSTLRFMLNCSIINVPKNTTLIGPAVRADFRRLYPANAKTPTCCPSDDNRTKVTNSVTSARSLWWHAGPYFWPADLTRTANPILQ